VFCVMSIGSFAQGFIHPVDWTYGNKDLGDGNFEIIVVADIDEGWHLYSQKLADGGPIPTTFTFDKGADAVIGEVIEEGDLEESYDELFDMPILQFSERVVFRVKVKGAIGDSVTVNVEYMACDSLQCTPPLGEDIKMVLDDQDFAVPALPEKKKE